MLPTRYQYMLCTAMLCTAMTSIITKPLHRIERNRYPSALELKDDLKFFIMHGVIDFPYNWPAFPGKQLHNLNERAGRNGSWDQNMMVKEGNPWVSLVDLSFSATTCVCFRWFVDVPFLSRLSVIDDLRTTWSGILYFSLSDCLQIFSWYTLSSNLIPMRCGFNWPNFMYSSFTRCSNVLTMSTDRISGIFSHVKYPSHHNYRYVLTFHVSVSVVQSPIVSCRVQNSINHAGK